MKNPYSLGCFSVAMFGILCAAAPTTTADQLRHDAHQQAQERSTRDADKRAGRSAIPRIGATPLWRLQPALPAPGKEYDADAAEVNVALEAARTAGGPGDLDPTADVQITQEIIDKANELGTPQAMYEFVRNECAFQPYYGSRKGSVETLRQRAGNDYDLASLLIALLRASGTPARYAEGEIELPTDRATGWLGVERGDTAGSILFTNGMEGTYIWSGTPDNIVAVRCQRVWVEAFVSRGFGSPTWIPLDPAFALNNVHPGIDIPEEMGLDAQDLVDEYYDPSDMGVTLPRSKTILEILEQDISDYVDTNYPGMTLDDVQRQTTIIPENLGLLPASLPYVVRSRDGAYSEIPADRRYQIRFHLHDGGTNLIDHTVNLPEIAGRRVTISYVGATPGDQAIIDANGGIFQTAPSTVDLTPVLSFDGQPVATGAAGVGMGLVHESDVYFMAPVNAGGLPQNVVPSIFNSIICGSSQAIAIGIEGAAETLALPPPAGDTEGTLSLLYDTAVDYLANVRSDDMKLGRLMHSYVTTDVTSAILENVVKVTYNGGGVPQSFDWAGLRVDADRSVVGVWPVDRFVGGDTEPRDFLLIGGANGSMWEHHIFETSFGQDSVSTIKILELAIDSGVTVYKRWGTLPLPTNTQPAQVQQALQNAIAGGKVVTFPADPMTIGDVGTGQWTGTGWIDQDPTTGAAGYLISGNNNGGATVEFWPPEFIDLQEGDRSVVNVEIEITQPDADSPDTDAVFTRDNEENLVFKYLLHVTYDDASMATLGPYEKKTRNTTKTFSPGNYTFHVWIARFSWFSFGIWTAERKVSIVGVLIRKDDGTPAGQDPPKFISVEPPSPKPTPFVNVKALVIPEKAPDGTTMMATAYSWTTNSTPKIKFTPTDQQMTKIEPTGADPSPSKENEEVNVEVTLIGGEKQKGYAKFKFAEGGEDEKHKMTAAKVLLKELTYAGSSMFAVRKDDNSGNYSAPHWKDNSSPSDGDAIDSGDRKYPVIFKKNTKMKVMPITFEVAPADAFTGTLKVTGDGPGNLDFPEKTGMLSGTTLTIPEIECSNPFVDAVDFFPDTDTMVLPGGSSVTRDGFLKIAWKVQPEGETECCDSLQPSSNQVYVTWKDPLPTPPTPTIFHTVAHLSCKNADGQNDKDPITTAVWGEFPDRDVRRMDGHQLTYYASFLNGNLNTQSLLANGDGQCGSWASLFLDMLRTQGIDNTNEYVLFRSTIGDGFLVKDWTLAAPGISGIAGFPQLSIPDTPFVTATAYNFRFTQATDDAGVPGQGTANPSSMFNNHQVVFINNMYYDPSYGATYTGASIAAAGIDDAALSAHQRTGTLAVNEADVGLDLSSPPDGDMTDMGVTVFVMVSGANPAGNNLIESKGDYPF